MQTKNIFKNRLAVLLLTVGLFSFKIIQPSKATNDLSFEEKFDDQTDSTKQKQEKKAMYLSITAKDSLFTKVDYPATFPDGLAGWRRHLEANLKYPKKAQKHNTQGVVSVIMKVDKNGNVDDVRALNDPGDGLAEEAERVIKISPNWNPAILNGNKVNYRFIQTVTFKLQ